MLTKEQKKIHIKAGEDLIKKSQNLIFVDFTGVSIEELKRLKNEIKKVGAQFKVIKKRLLKLAFKEAGIDFDPGQFEAQVGVIYIPEDLSSVAGQVYKLHREIAKTKKNFKILGAFSVSEKSLMTADQFTQIAKLPNREILLAMLVGVLSGPMRAMAYILDQASKKSGNETPASAEASAGKVEQTNQAQ
ncbi:MAG: 50S ribosomal protein L10 [Candidatus Harrisonbacteria bacterium]|nr:50S ribosomal protein L10 [Candidatus Harrisonbacteria bacterium]